MRAPDNRLPRHLTPVSEHTKYARVKNQKLDKRKASLIVSDTKHMQTLRHKERHAFAVQPKASDDLVWLLGRAYLNYVVFLQEQLELEGLAEHIRPGMGHFLFALFAEDGLTLRDLTARTGLAPSSVTETVQRMEREGLVKRARDREDKRAVRVTLTPAARALEPRLRAVAKRFQEVLEDGFSARDARRLRAGLSRVIENLHEHLKPSDPDQP